MTTARPRKACPKTCRKANWPKTVQGLWTGLKHCVLRTSAEGKGRKVLLEHDISQQPLKHSGLERSGIGLKQRHWYETRQPMKCESLAGSAKSKVPIMFAKWAVSEDYRKK
jgi:hypothetical protein